MTYDLYKDLVPLDAVKADFYLLKELYESLKDKPLEDQRNYYDKNIINRPMGVFHKACFLNDTTLLQKYVDYRQDPFDPVHSYFYCLNCDKISFDLHELSKLTPEYIKSTFITTLPYSILNQEYALKEVHSAHQIHYELVALKVEEMRTNLVKNFLKLRATIKC